VFGRRAVDVHGGTIWIDDGPGRGGCFCVRLPTARLPLGVPAASRAPAPAVRPGRGGIAIG
jgi:hypothetical protein